METKICSKCGKEKSVEEFGWRNKSKGYKHSWCRRCIKEYDKKRYEDNSEQYKEYSRKWRQNNPEQYKKYYEKYDKMYYRNNEERIKNQHKEWYRNNVEYCKKYNRQYKLNNRSILNALNAKRKAKKKNQTPINANKGKIKYIYELAYKMSKEQNIEYQVDHIKPLSEGGLHHENNLQILRKELNNKKSSKWPLTEIEKLMYGGIKLEDLKNGEENI